MMSGDDGSPQPGGNGASGGAVVPDGPPARTPPKVEGPSYQTAGVKFSLREKSTYEVHYQVPTDIITVNVQPLSSVDIACDSDRVQRLKVPALRMHFHPAGSEIYARSTDEAGGRLCRLEIDPSLRTSIESEMSAPRTSVRTVMNIGTPGVAALSEAIHRFMGSGGEGGSLVADSLAALAMTETLLALRDGNVDLEEGCGRLGRNVLNRTFDYIEAHLEEDIRLSDLAAIACLSQHHFSRAFKASTGKPPSIFVLERRVEWARKLLATTDQSIAWIAHTCGFSSQSHMTTAFRKLAGVTPAQFRKEGGGG